MNGNTLDTQKFFDNGKDAGAGRWQVGLFFIILGGIFLLGMSGVTILGYSPWILMALIPVYWIVMAAYRAYKADGRLTGRVLLMLVSSLLPFAFVAAGMLGFNLGRLLWPLILIAIGASFLLSVGRK
jgi:hypothetical protein